MTEYSPNITLSVFTPLRILILTAILSLLLSAGINGPYALAQTPGDTKGIVKEGTGASLMAQDMEKPASPGSPARREPELINETIEPVAESWGDAKGLGEKVDWIHANLYKVAHGQVERVDSWFRSSGEESKIIEPSRFRVGLFGAGMFREYKDTEVKPAVDFDTEIDLPNVRRRLKLIITTTDPAAMPGRSFIEQIDKSLRTVIVREWLPDLSTAVGVRLRWKPELFAYALWTMDRQAGNWRLYPQEKIYWENEKGLGEISSLVLDHWINRFNTRFSTSVKWSMQDRDDDQAEGRPDNGLRWSEVIIFDYAKELLDESHLGRVVSGYDIANGTGIRLSAFGGFHAVDEYRAGIFYRWPLRKKWVYAFLGPEINWKSEEEWNREWMIKFGLEMLFWGGKER